MMWRCAVWSKTYGWDEYLVTAEDIKQAKQNCFERLKNETDNPEDWEITMIIRVN